MNRLRLAGLAASSFLLAGAAFAADLPRRDYGPPPVIPIAPIFTWTGIYVGVNAGYGFSTNDRSEVFIPGIGTVRDGGGSSGFVGGGQIGYNYQFGQFVLGVETDIQFADLSSRGDRVFGSNGVDFFGTVRGRAGFAFDRALLYGTGGFAYGGGGGNNDCTLLGTICSNRDDVRGGWTVGGGLEYAFTPNLTGKVEGLFVNLDRSGNSVTVRRVVVDGRKQDEFGVVRAGLNFKFW